MLLYNMLIRIDSNRDSKLKKSYENNDLTEFKRLIDLGENVNCVANNLVFPSGKKCLGHFSLLCTIMWNFAEYPDDVNFEFFKAVMGADPYMGAIGQEASVIQFATNDLSKNISSKYLKLILQKDIDINCTGERKYGLVLKKKLPPPIFSKEILSNQEKLNLILSCNPNLKIKFDIYNTSCKLPILNYAIRCYFENNSIDSIDLNEMISSLIEHGADPSQSDRDSRNALHVLIAHTDDKKLYDILLENNVDINSKDQYGYTPLRHASFMSTIDLMQYFIERGADINTKCDHGITCAMVCAQKLDYKKLDFLFKSNANFMDVDNDGCGLSHYIVYGILNHSNCVDEATKFFKKHPKLLDVKNVKNETALDLLKKRSVQKHKILESQLSELEK